MLELVFLLKDPHAGKTNWGSYSLLLLSCRLCSKGGVGLDCPTSPSFLLFFTVIPSFYLQLWKIFFFFMTTPTACGSSQARDWIQAAATTYATATAMPDPWTHRTRWGLNPHLCSDPRHCSRILNPLCHSENSKKSFLSVFMSFSPIVAL